MGGQAIKNNKQTMAASNFKLSISQSTVMGKAAPTKAGVVFVVDRSASMTWNGELDAALNGVKTVTDQVVTENDVVTFWSFSNDLRLHFKAQPKSRIDWGRVETEINTDNGGTRLYDSIIEVVDGLPKRKNYIWDVVILTDGADGGGVHTADSVKAKLSNPGVATLTPSSWVSASRPLPRPSCVTCVRATTAPTSRLVPVPLPSPTPSTPSPPRSSSTESSSPPRSLAWGSMGWVGWICVTCSRVSLSATAV